MLWSDVAKDVAKVAIGVGLVVAESTRRLRFQDLGACASQTLKFFHRSGTRVADFASSEAEFQELRERKGRGAMENAGMSQSSTKKTEEQCGGGDVPQSEELFAPKKAEESREARRFVSVEADAGVEPVSQKVSLPSVDAHLPPK